MDEQQWQRRFDEHLKWMRRLDEHVETSKDHMREGNELMARIDETLARNREAFLDLRGYLQQATTVLGALVAEIRGDRAEQREAQRERREAQKEQREAQKEQREAREDQREAHEDQREAQDELRRALLAILDRLENGPSPSGA